MKIAVIGLGYVGLPLLYALSKKNRVVGYDINKKRTEALNKYKDNTNELSAKELKQCLGKCQISSSHTVLKDTNIFIVTVPTPLKNKKPDLSLVIKATKTSSIYFKKNCIFVLESTVYPGVTENICAKLIEKKTGLKYKLDFNCAYSPERINPGDKIRTIFNVTKVIGASNNRCLKIVKNIYSSFLGKNIHVTNDIKTAEASKVIENAQRDLNIAFMNEIQYIFDSSNINTYEVLEASKTKWNFLDFEPGLVGGHCIGIDPYYLSSFAKLNKINPRLILAGRKINENEKELVIKKIYKNIKANFKSKLLILGCTFKENCPDIRNSKVIEICNILKKNKNIKLDIFDPYVDPNQVTINKINFFSKMPMKFDYDVIAILVKHRQFKKININKLKTRSNNKKTIFIDYKNIFRNSEKSI